VAAELVLLSRVAYRDQEIKGPRLQGLLALLAGDLHTGVGTARLVDALWPDGQPDNPGKALQILVSRARAQLGPDLIARTPTGYRLALRDDQVDAAAVVASASASGRASRAGDHAAALGHAEDGLAWWSGEPAGDGTDPLSALRAERAATYRSLRRARALALSRLGRHPEAVEPLTEQAAARPRDEEVLLELLRSEAAAVGPAAALARYDAYRRGLRDELGSDPGAALQELHRQLLQGGEEPKRYGIPYEPNPLVGRDGDLAAVAELIRGSRVTSIVGPGGLGKTRLAYAVSREAQHRVVHLVPLAGVTRDEDVAPEVAAALGAGERRTPGGQLGAAPDALSSIAGALGTGPALLVLDNCEQVLAGAAELVRALVSMTRDLRVLTTSRAPLGLSSESVYPLPELSLPATVALFTQRARAARPGADLPADAVEQLCRRLDGLPLAVELAAARVRVMSVGEIDRHLDDRFGLLRGGPRDTPQRHRTLAAVVDWSWNLLDPAGQAAMRTLSVCPGGFSADAAAHLLADRDVLETLARLVDQSLLKVVEARAGTRFRMLETVREFSAGKRDAAGETERAVDGFLAWARDFGVAYHDAAFWADPYRPVARCRAEMDNILQALRLGTAREDGATVAAAFAVLGGVWGAIDSEYTRLAALAEEAGWVLSHYRPEPAMVEATRTALVLAAAQAFLISRPRATRALVTLRRLPPAPPDTLTRAVAIVLGSGTPPESDAPLLVGVVNALTSYAHENDGDRDGAMAAAERSLEAFDSQDLPFPRALGHGRIAELCLQAERGAEAQRHLRETLPVLERLGAWGQVVGIRWWMVLANLQLGDPDEAARWLDLTAPEDACVTLGTPEYGLGVHAEIALARGDVDTGLRLGRRAVDQLRHSEDPLLRPFFMEAQSVMVVAHAYHDRLDLVEDVIDSLPGQLSTVLTDPDEMPLPFLADFPIYGSMLLALAMVDIRRGHTRSGVRLVALAERFGYLKSFQPTMSSARVREAVARADKAAYDDAVSSYAALPRDRLPAAALAALRARS
jgi:predicted ATPase/DNA-binding SARP family transcriptional activator